MLISLHDEYFKLAFVQPSLFFIIFLAVALSLQYPFNLDQWIQAIYDFK